MTGVEKVLIVGGGIAGTTLAVALARRGIEAEIAEVTPEWSVSGIGIMLSGPALRALRVIDQLDRSVDEGFGVRVVTNCDVDGRVQNIVHMPRLNGPDYPATVGIMRPALYRILRDAVEAVGVRVRLGVTVAALRHTPAGVDVELTDGTHAAFDLVVGADGIHSNLRDLVFGDSQGPGFTGQATWRATVPRPPEVDSLQQFYGPRNKAGCNPVSHEQMYIYLVENTNDPSRRPQQQLPERMREMLADFGGILGEGRERIVDPEQIVQHPIRSLLLRPPWHRGRVVLIGDAAHAAPPHLGSGAMVAIEDAIVLAEMLNSDGQVGDVLASFVARRFERCRIVVENSVQLGEWEKHPDPAADPIGLMNESYAALAQPY